jgi:hypothetical protein
MGLWRSQFRRSVLHIRGSPWSPRRPPSVSHPPSTCVVTGTPDVVMSASRHLASVTKNATRKPPRRHRRCRWLIAGPITQKVRSGGVVGTSPRSELRLAFFSPKERKKKGPAVGGQGRSQTQWVDHDLLRGSVTETEVEAILSREGREYVHNLSGPEAPAGHVKLPLRNRPQVITHSLAPERRAVARGAVLGVRQRGDPPSRARLGFRAYRRRCQIQEAYA